MNMQRAVIYGKRDHALKTLLDLPRKQIVLGDDQNVAHGFGSNLLGG